MWKVVAPIALAIAVLVSTGPALAQDTGLDVASTMAGAGMMLNNPQSVESETTFGLMENEGDFIWEPAELGALQGWKRDRTIGNKWDPAAKWDGGWFLWSNLGNTVTQDAYQLGTWGKLGPGNLAVIFAYRQDKSDTQYSDTEMSGIPSSYTIDYGDTIFTETQFGPTLDSSSGEGETHKSDYSSQDVYVAYGLPIGDHMWLGGSWRHGNAKNTWENGDSSSSSSFTYDTIYTPPPEGSTLATWTRIVDYTDVQDDKYSSNYSGDLTTDVLAVEFKMRPTDDMSFKVRGFYDMITQDQKWTYQEDYTRDRSWPAAGDEGMYGYPYTIDETETYTQTRQDWTDMSLDGNVWGLAGKFNWYRGTGGLQVDFAYTDGSYDFKNSTPEQTKYTYTDTYRGSYLESGSTSGTDEGGAYVDSLSLAQSMTYDDLSNGAWHSTLTGKDLTSSAWLIGGKYLWVWDKADFLVGLRYWQTKYEATFSWANANAQSGDATWTGYDYPNTDFSFSTTYADNPDLNSTYTYTYTDTLHETADSTYGGTWATSGTIKGTYIDLPLAVIFHVTDKFALRFGVQHTFSTYEYTGTNSSLSNGSASNYAYTYTSHEDNDGTVTDYSEEGSSHYVDDVSYSRDDWQTRGKYDDSVTSYRIGAEYKFNDHVLADLMVNETSGGNDNRESVALKYVVAGVSIRF